MSFRMTGRYLQGFSVQSVQTETHLTITAPSLCPSVCNPRNSRTVHLHRLQIQHTRSTPPQGVQCPASIPPDARLSRTVTKGSAQALTLALTSLIVRSHVETQRRSLPFISNVNQPHGDMEQKRCMKLSPKTQSFKLKSCWAKLPATKLRNTTAAPLLQTGGRTLDDDTDRV